MPSFAPLPPPLSLTSTDDAVPRTPPGKIHGFGSNHQVSPKTEIESLPYDPSRYHNNKSNYNGQLNGNGGEGGSPRFSNDHYPPISSTACGNAHASHIGLGQAAGTVSNNALGTTLEYLLSVLNPDQLKSLEKLISDSVHGRTGLIPDNSSNLFKSHTSVTEKQPSDSPVPKPVPLMSNTAVNTSLLFPPESNAQYAGGQATIANGCPGRLLFRDTECYSVQSGRFITMKCWIYSL